MKLPDLPSPRAPGIAAVDTGAVDRVADVTRQRLTAVNSISQSLSQNYEGFLNSKLRADRSEAVTRSRMYETQLKDLYMEMSREWDALPLDRPVPDLREEFNSRRDELRRKVLDETPGDVSRFMDDTLDLADAQANLQVDVFAVEQNNARAVHHTAVELNAVSNDIYDVATDEHYEMNVQRQRELINSNLPGIDPAERGKLLRDTDNDATIQYVKGLLKKGQFQTALAFLDNDQRSDDRLYNKSALREQVMAASHVANEKSKVLIEEYFRQAKDDIVETGQSDYLDLLKRQLNQYSGTTLADREYRQLMESRIAQLEKMAPMGRSLRHFGSMPDNDLQTQRALYREHLADPGATVETREFARAAIERIDKHLSQRRNNPTEYLTEASSMAGALNDQFTNAIADLVRGQGDPEDARILYQQLKLQLRGESEVRGMDPMLLTGPIPVDSPVGQLIQNWVNEPTGPDMLYARGTALKEILGGDAAEYLRSAKNPIAMSVAGATTIEKARDIWTGHYLQSPISESLVASAMAEYTHGMPLGINNKQIVGEVYALYKLYNDREGNLKQTNINPDLLERAVWEATGIMAPGSYGSKTRSVESYITDKGEWATPSQMGNKMRYLGMPDAHWEEYAVKTDPAGDYRPRYAGLGGSFRIGDLTSLRGKMSLVKVQGSIYKVVLVGSRGHGEDGHVTDGNGNELLIDFSQVPEKPLFDLQGPGRPPYFDEDFNRMFGGGTR